MLKNYLPEMSDMANNTKPVSQTPTSTSSNHNLNNINMAAPFNEFNHRFKHGRYSYSKFLEAIGAFRNMYSDMRPRLNLNDAPGYDGNSLSDTSSAMIRTKPHAIFCSAHCEVAGALSCNKCIVKLHQFMSERNIDHLFANPRFKLNSVATMKAKNELQVYESPSEERKRVDISIPSASTVSDSERESDEEENNDSRSFNDRRGVIN